MSSSLMQTARNWICRKKRNLFAMDIYAFDRTYLSLLKGKSASLHKHKS